MSRFTMDFACPLYDSSSEGEGAEEVEGADDAASVLAACWGWGGWMRDGAGAAGSGGRGAGTHQGEPVGEPAQDGEVDGHCGGGG